MDTKDPDLIVNPVGSGNIASAATKAEPTEVFESTATISAEDLSAEAKPLEINDNNISAPENHEVKPSTSATPSYAVRRLLRRVMFESDDELDDDVILADTVKEEEDDGNEHQPENTPPSSTNNGGSRRLRKRIIIESDEDIDDDIIDTVDEDDGNEQKPDNIPRPSATTSALRPPKKRASLQPNDHEIRIVGTVKDDERDGNDQRYGTAPARSSRATNQIDNNDDENQQSESELVVAPYFELRKLLNGSQQLFIFTSDDDTKCYRYYQKSTNVYRCSECMNKKGTYAYATIKENLFNETYVELTGDHVCDEMIDYYYGDIIPITNFEHYSSKANGKELFIFADDDKTTYYRFLYNEKKNIYSCNQCISFGKSTLATVKEENGKEIVVEADPIHRCEPMPYIPKVQKPHYLIRESTRGNPELVIYADEEHKTYYQYYWLKAGKFFACNKCGKNGKRVTAKEWKLPDGERFVQCYDAHVCDPLR